MIETNIAAFNNLIEDFSTGSDELVENGKRYIKTNTAEKEWLQKLVIENSLRILSSVTIILIKYEDFSYIAFIGNKLDEVNLDTHVLQNEPLNAGLITVLLAENFLKLSKSTLLDFYNDILFQHKEPEYKGHDYEDIVPFLNTINFYQIPKDSVLSNNNLYKIATYLIAIDKQYLILDFSNVVINLFADLSLMGSEKIEFEFFLNSLLSSNFKHSFLELYRLVERIFPLNYLKELHVAVTTAIPFLSFAALVEEKIGWRPREEDALEKIFEKTSSSTTTLFLAVFQNPQAVEVISCSKQFYKLRNSIVHFRANHTEPILNQIQWNLIIQGTLELIDQHYSENSTFL